MARSLERRDSCCLCGKTKEQVKKLIVGLHGAVCNDCIDLCNDILHNAPDGYRKGAPPDLELMERGYTLDVVPAVARVFPDPAELTEILIMLARSVDSRARRVALEGGELPS